LIRRVIRAVVTASLVVAGLVAVAPQPAAAAATWQAVPVPLPEGRRFASATITAFGPDSALMYASSTPPICFECTYQSHIFQWDGTAWTTVTIPPNAAGGRPTYAGDSPANQWSFRSASSNFLLSAYQWNGSTWTEHSPPGCCSRC
jgi:hypothetical protein